MGMTKEALLEATRLTRQGRLMEATRAIQQALGMGRGHPPAHDAPETDAEAQPMTLSVRPDEGLVAERVLGEADVIDVPFRELRADRHLPEPDLSEPHPPDRGAPELPPRPARPRTGASFTAHAFHFGGHRYRYRLYEPEREPGVLLPVVVMLHGCKQDSEDFARGTRMNEVAAREGFLVLYPEQLRKANGMGCWNWFEPQHQRRGAGEPAMIAALVEATVAAHGGDPGRVYVAGLSAGGALAAALGELYPDVFAAVGVHSGLPPLAADGVTSAFGAMRKGVTAAVAAKPAVAVPTIVFHGTGDRTVAPANGHALVQRQLAARRRGGLALEHVELREPAARERGITRGATREQWVDAEGHVWVESWRIVSGPHAWSGGHSGGSFTDPQGPSASEAMARFFLRHRKA